MMIQFPSKKEADLIKLDMFLSTLDDVLKVNKSSVEAILKKIAHVMASKNGELIMEVSSKLNPKNHELSYTFRFSVQSKKAANLN